MGPTVPRNEVISVKMDAMSTQAPATIVSRESFWNHVPRPVVLDVSMDVIGIEETARVDPDGKGRHVTVNDIIFSSYTKISKKNCLSIHVLPYNFNS